MQHVILTLVFYVLVTARLISIFMASLITRIRQEEAVMKEHFSEY
ncbi:MAG TPA: hypothetical protein VGE90_02545 [Chitinophaga sp.]